MKSVTRALLAEFIGTAVLTTAILGSAILGSNISTVGGVVLLINMVSTVLVLGLLIAFFGAASGAHFNPVVSFTMVVRQQISATTAVLYIVAQLVGAALGAVVANLMFGLDAVTVSTVDRTGTGTFIGEVVATAGLILTILVAAFRDKGHLIPVLVPAWIGGAILFTSSTAFANPAASFGRMLSNTAASLSPASLGQFVIAQFIGAIVGMALAHTFLNGTK